jgi:hypothetical protein
MKRIAIALGLAAASMFAVVGLTTPANATTWTLYKDLPDLASCQSAGYYFQHNGTITSYYCDEVNPPSADARGDVLLYVIF